MDGLLNGRFTDGWIDGCLIGWIDEGEDRWKIGYMDECVDGRMDVGWMDELIGGWMDGW
jgi:hypothetical protein